MDFYRPFAVIAWTCCALGMSAQAAITITPPSVDFGRQAFGEAHATVGVVVANTGASTVLGSGASITGANPADFSVTIPPACFALSQGQQCTIQVGFKPSGLGPRSAQLTLTSNDPGSPHVLPLAGTGYIRPQVAAASTHTLALDTTGHVTAWGSDSNGQLGQGRAIRRESPVQVPGLPKINQVSVNRQVLAVDEFKQVWSWGEGCYGSLGTRDGPDASKPARVTGLTNVIAVQAAFCQSIALKADGTVWRWGLFGGHANDPVQVQGLSNVVQIAAGESHVLALRADHTVVAFGDNSAGALGLGHTSPDEPPTVIPSLANVKAVAAHGGRSMALLTDGTVLHWGGEFSSTIPNVLSPTVLVGIGPAKAITLSQVLPSAVLSDGTVWVCYYNTTTCTWSQYAGFTGISTFDSNGNGYMAIDGAGQLFATGDNTAGELGQGDTLDRGGSVVSVPGMTQTKQVSIARNFSVLAVKTDGTLWAWGANPLGQTGDGAAVRSSVPLSVTIPATIRQVAVAPTYSMALDTAGHVWGWGFNYYQWLGAPGIDRSAPALIPLPPALDGNVQAIAAGDQFTLFLQNDGTVWVSGAGFVNTLGPPSDNVRQVAYGASALSGIVKIAAGQNGYAIDGSGTLWSWGINQYGQVGNGSIGTTTTPTAVQGFGGASVVTVSEGLSFGPVGAVTSDGKAWMWGNVYNCCLGNGSTAISYVPAQVTGISDAVDISVGRSGTLLLRQGGVVSAWGQQTITPAFPGIQTTPYTVPLGDTVQAVASAGSVGFLVGSKGLLRAYGYNVREGDATVGDGAFVLRNSPVIVFAANGAGSVDGNDWYLDLDPTTAETIGAAEIPGALAIARASGSDGGVSLSSVIKYKNADFGKKVSHYVLAVVPPEFFGLVTPAPGASSVGELKAKAAKSGGFVLAQLTPAGWVDVSGQLIAYSQGTANAAGGAANILNGVNTAALSGARFCVGYGDSAQSMLTSSALREVLRLEGATATVSNVPCVLSGVYVDGPPASLQGSAVTFKASVIGLSPTGSVQFRDGFASLGSFALSASNAAVASASLATASLSVGTHSIGASYSGDTQNVAATTAIPVLHTVSAMATVASTQTDLEGPASSLLATEIVFIATVSGSAPTGTVQFSDGAANVIATVPLVNGSATLRTSALALGSHSISAAYSGDANNTVSTSNAVSHVVANAIGTRVTLTPSTASPKIGTAVTLTATVSGSSPSGSVQFYDGAAQMASATLSGGQAAFATSSLAPGTHTLTARYSGDANNTQATSNALSLDVALAIDPAAANVDTDGDGIPNAAEESLGRNANLRDNNVFADTLLFAMQQYRDFLGREGDAGGIAAWSGNLNSGVQTRAQVIESFFGSQEFQGTIAPVARLYFAYFLRIPDYAGINFWIGYYRAGNSLDAISNAFAASAEFTNTYGALDNAGFVNLVYQNVLGRAPDAGGFAFWKGRLDSAAATRGQVMLGFSESEEYRGTSDSMVYVTMMYIGMLRRAPEQQGFDFWVSYRNAGNSGLALIDGFLGSAEYRGRFLP